jgi:hypothetical protein
MFSFMGCAKAPVRCESPPRSRAEMGQGHFYQQRERLKYAQGDGSLRHDEDGSIGGFEWPGGVLCGDGCLR